MKKTNLLYCILLLIICAVLLLSCNSNPSEDFEFQLKSDGTYYIKSVLSKNLDSITIPQEYNGKKVTGIDDGAFRDCSKLKSVIIPDGLVELGDNIFENCSSLENIKLPNTIQKIGNDVFKNCNSLKYNVDQNGYYLGNDDNKFVALIKGIDNSVTSFSVNDNCSVICYSALYSFAQLKEITMPYSIKDIGTFAFGNCTALEEFNVPNYVTEFSILWFQRCDSLKKITISANVKTVYIPNYTFYCKNLSEYEVYSTNSNFSAKNGVLYSKDLSTLLSYPAGKTESHFSIPSYVECLATYAFNDCNALTSLSIGRNVRTLRSSAVINCDNLHVLNYSGTKADWIDLDNANSGWDHSFVVNKVTCSDGAIARSRA